MPAPFILPPNPGFGSQLGQALGGGISQGIGVSLNQFLEQKQLQQKNQSLMQALGLGSPQGQGINPEIATAGKEMKSGGLPKLSQEQLLAASIQNPALAPALGAIYKNQQKEIKESEDIQRGQDSLDRMAQILNEGKIGFGSKTKGKIFGGKTAEDVGEFESLTGALESLLVDKVSRGTLSNSRFRYITETLLPKPNDRDATIRGKIKALSKELGLKLPELKPQKAKKSMQSQSGDFVLMQDPNGVVRKIPKSQAIEAQRAGGKLVQ